MMSNVFRGFSEVDIEKVRKTENGDIHIGEPQYVKIVDKMGGKPKHVVQKNDIYKTLPNESPAIPDQAKLFVKETNLKNVAKTVKSENNLSPKEITPTTPEDIVNKTTEGGTVNTKDGKSEFYNINLSDEPTTEHALKLEQLQLQQRLMEEQNKKRKEMLARALADRTRKTAEEVIKLEKIKKELQVLDGQFSQDVAVLRKKIDQACHSYADTEKQYLRIEKEFLAAKINLQKEKERKELLTEHLCALITHNETRKAKKLEKLMVQLSFEETQDDKAAADDKSEVNSIVDNDNVQQAIEDGVDPKTGKMLEMDIEKPGATS